MININRINEKLSELQGSSINCGGIWEARLFPKNDFSEDALSVLRRVFQNHRKYNNLERHKEFAEKGGWNPEENRLIKNLVLIEIPEWKILCLGSCPHHSR